MLSELSLKNFKSWKDTGAIAFGPITGVFGTNSSGKTSLLQLLLLLKQTADSPDRAQVLRFGDDRSFVNLGTFRDVAFQHDIQAALDWRVRWRLESPLRVGDPEVEDSILFEGSDMTFSASVRQDNKERLFVEQMTYKLGEASVSMQRKPSGDKYDLRADVGAFKLKRAVGRPWDLPHPVKCYGFPDQIRAYFQNAGFLSDLELKFEQLLSGVFYLGPLRDYPKREYTWAGARPADMGPRGERVVDALLASRHDKRRISRGQGKRSLGVEEYVAHWLRELGLIDEFSVKPIAKDSNLYRVSIKKTKNAAEVLITDVGFGISQILPVITLCYYVPSGSIVILEQPEIHLHPSVQAGLADVLVDAVTRNRIQVILESHSEHLLRRLQLRIAEGQLKASDTKLYFCSLQHEESQLEHLRLDMFGRIENWPTDFFGDEFEDRAAMSRAIADRAG